MAARKYESPRRTDLALATREAILTSAYELFRERGYAEVTIGDIAKAATVATPTVYNSVGGKAKILATLLEPAIGDSHVKEALAAVEACDDAVGVVELTARGTRLTHEKHWHVIFELFYRHPPGEPSVKAVLDRGDQDYVQALGRVADRLVRLHALDEDVDRTRALDVLWFYLGPHAWLTLVGERGWSFDDAQRWIARGACRSLLKRK
ncbi:TetR/AcrR family transcriptional regulator [Nocardiopsis mangrovi]|uniref:TetR/AcrR family transcriptional regulator n=1 Tax=Nocardiopsis mangrovi TaxID=1179818 RepID=A0ABV9DVB9_9ACTN